MDVVSSASAVTQLLGQTINLWQQISQARQAVRLAPKTLAETRKQLSGLRATIDLVHCQPTLNHPDIDDVLKLTYDITEELHQILEDMAALQRKSLMRQSLHALRRRERDQAKLNDVLVRLERAKLDLSIRMNTVHVGMTGEMMEGVMKVKERVQTVIHGRDGDVEPKNDLVLQRNVAEDEADQLNGVCVGEGLRMSTTANIRDNKALGKSRQKNIIIGATSDANNEE